MYGLKPVRFSYLVWLLFVVGGLGHGEECRAQGGLLGRVYGARRAEGCPAVTAEADHEREAVVKVMEEVQGNGSEHEEDPALFDKKQVEAGIKRGEQGKQHEPD